MPKKLAAVAVFLLVLSGPISAQKKSSSWIKGTWEGTGYQTDDQSTWAMVLSARVGRFSIEYPSLSCGGHWQLVSLNAYQARFKERLDHGQDKCSQDGNITIQRVSKRQVLFL